jgi:hypothetical protein
VKEVSQDKPVTPEQSARSFPGDWLARSLAFAPITLLRLRHIEKMFGTARRASKSCGCEKDSRFPSPQDRAIVWGAVQPVETVRQVLVSTPCRLMPFGWLVLSPNGGMYSWGEVVEVPLAEGHFFSEDSFSPEQPRTLEQWEKLGGADLKFRICQSTDVSLATSLVRSRQGLVTELLQRNPQYSHINLSLPVIPGHPLPGVEALRNQFPDLEVEVLRERYIPEWRQSGDMAYRQFTTYTITRKDI